MNKFNLEIKIDKEQVGVKHPTYFIADIAANHDGNLKRAVQSGMRKVNIATHLNHVFTDEIREFLASNPEVVDPRKYMKKARASVASETARLINLLSLK